MDFLCRACMELLAPAENSIEPAKHHIFLTANLVKKFTVCTSLNVEPTDDFPKYLCNSCCDKVNEFHKFHVMCVESVQRFHEMQKRENLNEVPMYDLKEFTLEEPIVEENRDAEITAGIRMRKAKTYARDLLEASESEVPDELHDELLEPLSNNLDCRSFNEEKPEANEEKFSFTQQCKMTNCNKHKNDTHGGKHSSVVYRCDVCPSYYSIEQRLIEHKRCHVPYPCPREGCEESFNGWQNLSEHLQQHDDGNYKPKKDRRKDKPQKRNAEPKSFVCNVCSKVFKARRLLNEHNYTHKDKSELKYGCDKCGQRFYNQLQKKVHMMRHEGIKNFECPHCGLRTTTRGELRTHMNYHTLERTWTCSLCSETFRRASNLTMHMRHMHDGSKAHEKPYACRVCGTLFRRKAAVTRHEKVHKKNCLEYIAGAPATTAQETHAFTKMFSIVALCGVNEKAAPLTLQPLESADN